jgi:putative ABC transport system permease protein
LGRSYENFGVFLNLVAFIALLLGCIGIASSVHIYIKEKLKDVAILKCLGASVNQTFSIYLIQISIMGFMGGILGSIGGLLLQELFPLLLMDYFPFDIEITISIWPVLMGILLGLFMSVLFALLPLLETRIVSPLRVLRIEDGLIKKSIQSKLMVFTGIFLFLYLFSFWLLNNWKFALFFILGVIFTFLILSGITVLFLKALKRFFPTNWGYCARQSLLNLFRPQNQTMTLIIAIGVGTFLISTLYFSKDMLINKLSLDKGTNMPNIILMDVQAHQREAVVKSLENVIDNIPIITMRVHSINGINSNEIRKDTTSKVNNWMLNHEFRVTYRDSLVDSESLKDGKWVPSQNYDPDIPVSISISESIERDGLLKVGDSLTFNVQGLIMKTKVANIRIVDWGRMQPNFSIVFPKGILEDAPQFSVLTSHTKDEASSAILQNKLVKQFPNISIIDLRQMLMIIENILSKISWVINFMAFFSIFTGIVVLFGAVRTSKYQRIKENVLLRTIGATGNQILKITFLEYLYLGILGSLSGIFLSLISSQLLGWYLFELAFLPSFIPLVILFPSITLLVILIGLGNSRSVLKSPPLQVLRREGL